MKVRKELFDHEYVEMSLEDCIETIIKYEDGYFLDYNDPEEIYNDFLGCASIYVDYDGQEELESNKKEVVGILLEQKERLNSENYNFFVEEGAQFLRDTWLDDFMDSSYHPVFGEAKEKAFVDTIKFLYEKYCNEKVE